MVNLRRTVVAAFLAVASIEAFSNPAFQPRNTMVVKRDRIFNGASRATLSDDCGCQTEFSGKTPVTARTLNHREAIREHPIYNVDGEPVTMDQLIGKPISNQISVVVFLRSLG